MKNWTSFALAFGLCGCVDQYAYKLAEPTKANILAAMKASHFPSVEQIGPHNEYLNGVLICRWTIIGVVPKLLHNVEIAENGLCGDVAPKTRECLKSREIFGVALPQKRLVFGYYPGTVTVDPCPVIR